MNQRSQSLSVAGAEHRMGRTLNGNNSFILDDIDNQLDS